MNAAKVLEDLKRRFPNEPEYHQAVEEVLGTIEVMGQTVSSASKKQTFLQSTNRLRNWKVASN